MKSKAIKYLLLVLSTSLLSLAFGTVLKAQPAMQLSLSPQQKAIVGVASLTGTGKLADLRNEFDVALDAGLTISQIKEIVVHTYAYAGFPRSIRGLQTLMTVLAERKARGITDELGHDATPISDSRAKYERGKAILDSLTGTPQAGPQTGYAAFAPIIEVFLKEHLFADIFERDVLTFAERELTTIAVLAAIGGVEPMLRSHYDICLHVGLTPDQLQDVITIIGSTIGQDEAAAAQQVLYDLLSKK